MNKKPDGVFLLVDLTIENTGRESTTLSTDYVKLEDEQGRTFESDNSAWAYIDNNILMKQVQPGLPTKGQTIFDVPRGGGYYLVVTDSIFGTHEAKIELGRT